MAESDRIRIEIGFDGGQGIAALVDASAADALERALETGDGGMFALEAEDGRYTLSLKRVLYVKQYVRESRLGFGSS